MWTNWTLNCLVHTLKIRWSYFVFSSQFVWSGLLTATVSSEVFKAAQPALLYLVPFTLLPLLTMAYLKVNSVVKTLLLSEDQFIWGCLLPVVCEQDQSCCFKDHFSVPVILSLIYYCLSGRSKKNVEWTFHCTAFSKEFGCLRIFKYYGRQLLKNTATTSKIVDSDNSTGRFQSDLFQMEDCYLKQRSMDILVQCVFLMWTMSIHPRHLLCIGQWFIHI